MKPRISLRRSWRIQTTSLTLSGQVARISLQIESSLSPRERRAIALAFLRQVRPFLKYFGTRRMTHFDHLPDFNRDEERGIFDPKSEDFDHPLAQQGFEIRMRRLNLGWTQRKLAEQAGLCVTQISKIERGLSRPHSDTLFRLEKAFAPSPTKSEKS